MPAPNAEAGGRKQKYIDALNPYFSAARFFHLNYDLFADFNVVIWEGVQAEFDPTQVDPDQDQSEEVQVYKTFTSAIPNFGNLNTKFEAKPKVWNRFWKMVSCIYGYMHFYPDEDNMDDFFGNNSEDALMQGKSSHNTSNEDRKASMPLMVLVLLDKPDQYSKGALTIDPSSYIFYTTQSHTPASTFQRSWPLRQMQTLT
ncbi:hypothetical protein DFH29DRAFT_879981 [Suillus ampliporus]|nr:hypothetical protein DFH29DRAFT_879981 [Suillus ampliporus]